MKRFLSALGELSLRVAGFIVAAVAILLTVALVIEYTGTQNTIAVGVALLCVFISAVGGLLARSAWRRGAYPEFAMGLVMWMIGATFLGINELGYWSQNYEAKYSKYLDTKHARTRADALNQRDFQALITGEAPETVAQVTASLDAKKLDPLYERSASCSSVTKEDSRQFCQELFALKGRLAKAEKLSQMETRVNAVTPAAIPDGIAGNVFANAELLARWFGGDEREWADFITIASLLVLMVMRDCGFLVAFPLGRRRDAATLPVQPAKADPVADSVTEQLTALHAAVSALRSADKAPRAPLPVTLGKLTGGASMATPREELTSKALLSNEFGAKTAREELGLNSQATLVGSLGKDALHSAELPSPDGGGGTHSPAPEPVDDDADTQEEEIAAKAENVYDFPFKAPAEERQEAKAKRAEKFEKLAKKKTQTGKGWEAPIIQSWLAECCTELPQQLGVVDKDAPGISKVFESFEAWRILRDEREIHKKRFSTVLAGLRNMPPSKGKDGHRGKGGRKFDYLRVYEPVPVKRRATA